MNIFNSNYIALVNCLPKSKRMLYIINHSLKNIHYLYYILLYLITIVECIYQYKKFIKYFKPN